MAMNPHKTNISHRVLFCALALSVFSACSGNLSGGATSPVQPNMPGSVMPQGNTVANVSPQSSPTPLPSEASTQVTVTASSTPYPLPSVGGYGGTIAFSVPSPVPSESPKVNLRLNIAPKNAPTRTGVIKDSAVLPILVLSLDPSGDSLSTMSGLKFSLPASTISAVKHLALGLYETRLIAPKRSLFGHRRAESGSSLIALDDSTHIDNKGVALSKLSSLYTLKARHHYAYVLFGDVLPVASSTPSSLASSGPYSAIPMGSSDPNAKNVMSPTPNTSAVPIPLITSPVSPHL
jgi:hypothetical protein